LGYGEVYPGVPLAEQEQAITGRRLLGIPRQVMVFCAYLARASAIN
jgi:hypothetical protein